MYDDLRGRLKELAKIELADDGMGIFRISAEGLEIIKGLATAAEAVIEDLSEQISEQEVTPEAEHFIDKYADRILGELQELKGSIKDKPCWIPVTERLPEDGSDVLAYLKYEVGGRIAAANYDKGMWQDCLMGGLYRTEEGVVTHWMPIPQPPEEDATT